MSFKKFFKKNEDHDKSDGKKGIGKLLDKEGFYIIMFLCVCIVAVTAVWTAKSNIDRIAENEVPKEEEIDIGESEIIGMEENDMKNRIPEIVIIEEETEPLESEPSMLNVQPNEESPVERETKPQPKPNENMESKMGKTLVEGQPKETQAADDEEDVIEASSGETIQMNWPAKGELGMEYAVETLIYSKTLDHFTTHHGIDILAEENDPVKAALAGEVIEILTDSRLGITISIDHKNGLVTRYSNLCTDEIVNVGDKVAQGQTISGVGTSSIFDSAEGPHLHFEVLLNGERVNPIDYLAEE